MSASGIRGYALGIDLGTSSLKTVLLDSEGKLVASASREYPTYVPFTGWAEQEPADWQQALREALHELRAAISAWPPLDAIGVCSAAHIPVLLDERTQVLRRSILWHDTRSGEEVKTLTQAQTRRIRELTANTPDCCWTLPQLIWLRHHEPELLAQTTVLLTSKDYINFLLTGIPACDHTSAAGTMLYDMRDKRWSADLIAFTGLPYSALPKIHSSTAEIGKVTQKAAAEFGLPAGTPVIAGMLDSAAEMVSAAALSPGRGVLRLGSAGGIMLTVKKPVVADGLITYPDPFGRSSGYRQAGTNCCALALRWLRDLFRDENGSVPDWARLDHLAAETCPGANGLFFHPYLQGERAPYWDASLRGSFTGLSLMHNRPELVRAVMEGVAYSLLDCLESFGGEQLRELSLVGGGANSGVWPQIVADVLNLPLRICRPGNSAHGVALAAGIAGGGFAKEQEQRDRLAILHPDPQRAAFYQDKFCRYSALQRALAPIYQTTMNYNVQA